MDPTPSTEPRNLDVLIVGAGLSGIGAAHHLQTRCPGKSYAILEARQSMGGTWDLFRYPGIRSDSDMHTLGYSFKPWTHEKAIADGPSILDYIRETAEEGGIDRHIRYGHQVIAARWSSETARWTVEARQASTGEVVELTCNFLFMCAGYYDYDRGHEPQFAGRERFAGEVVHPQHWPEDLDYAGKRVVVIGSGATAVTLLPALAKQAAHVTMLQRSPTYVLTLPARDPLAEWMRDRLPETTAYSLVRWKNVLMAMAMYAYCRRFPKHSRRLLMGLVRKQIGDHVDVDTHFNPKYDPWDQRLCFVPDEDLFEAIRQGRASVVTGHIDRFTEGGVLLESGEEIEADVIVTATGLKLKILGGLQLEVDGEPIDPAETMAYKGTMLSDVPNMFMALGYTNASWTLKCDLSSEWACRLISHMDAHGQTICRPRRDPSMEGQPILDLASGYVQRAIDQLPRQGTASPWRLYQNYVLDRLLFRHAKIDDGVLELTTHGRG